MSQEAIEGTRDEVGKAPPTQRRQNKGRSTRRTTKPESGRTQTKKQQLIRMLNGKTGADVATISDKLGWQQHTTRAALTHLRKAGYEVAAEKPADGKPSRYRITGTPEKT